ncbi:hypothetical protein LWI29_024258 [Acer saccharum]|uniref:Uncharacterized protein n=1 Tax=Acer saccharum TaxID=4024 RepID=A0AA39W2P0_ACESA|nr:hypothetical protein LWI29_024258 [Acer saccharum]
MNLTELLLSSCLLTVSIPSTEPVNSTSFTVLDLSSNPLNSELPDWLVNVSTLVHVDLSYFNLYGRIPLGFSELPNLQYFNLAGNNNLSNGFSEEIPPNLSDLSSLQVLDLAENNLTGRIPGSLGDLQAMAQEQIVIQYLLYYEENLMITAKRQLQLFTKALSLVTSLDLSGSNLSGDFPEELTKLSGLVVLNLSRNHISGKIPENISSLHQLSSLDLSSNNLLGSIPPTLSSLSFIGYLNLSNDDFSGTIPYAEHLTTYNASSFFGNPALCGPPLNVKCQDEDSDSQMEEEVSIKITIMEMNKK